MPIKVEDLKEITLRRNSRPISATHPEAAVTFHRTKNCGFSADDFSHGSTIEVWWQCEKSKDHVYQSAVKVRIRGLTTSTDGCPFCAGLRPSPTNWLNDYKKVASEFHPTKNGKLTPSAVVSGSNKKIYWKCKDCSHVYLQSPYARTRDGAGCPKCNWGERLNLNKFPQAMRMFDGKKNKGIDPTSIPAHTKLWWQCPVAKDHRFQAGFYKANGPKPDCPFCRGKRASSTNNLASNRRLAKEFHPTKNKGLSPKDLTSGSHKLVWWKCPKGPDHEWQQHVFARKHGRNCPYCAGYKLSKSNTLKAHPKIAKEFLTGRNGISPDKLLATSIKKAFWRCSKCRCEWEMSPYRRVTEGAGCPECYKKAHKSGHLSGRQKEKVLKLLKKGTPVKAIAEIVGIHIMTVYRLRDKGQ